MGQVDLELIESFDGEDIAVGAFIKKNKGNGIQHISFMVDDIDEKCSYFEDKGLEVVQRTVFPGGRAAFISVPEMGADIELLEGATKEE